MESLDANVSLEGRRTIIKVFHFLKDEYEFTKAMPFSDISHLENIAQRTANATGVAVETVREILKEDNNMRKKKHDELESDECSSDSTDAAQNAKMMKVDLDDSTADSPRAEQDADVPDPVPDACGIDMEALGSTVDSPDAVDNADADAPDAVENANAARL